MKHEQIKIIQNGVWSAYSKFRETKDMKQYNQAMAGLRTKVDEMNDKTMLLFFSNICISYAGIVNEMKGWE